MTHKDGAVGGQMLTTHPDYAMRMVDGAATQAARSAEGNKPLRFLARTGFVANGLLHGVIGAIAISVALGGGGGEADQSGALRQLAAAPGGAVLLWAIVVGLLALGLWEIVQVFVIVGPDPKRKWAHRLGELGKAVGYLAAAALAFTFASGGSTNSADTTQDFSASLLAAPGGVVVMIALGLVVGCIGGYFIFNGATKKFTQDIIVPPEPTGTIVTTVGIVGYIAKGIALFIVGVLFVVAAVTFDPSKATGLDGALKSLVALPFGTVILTLVGIGLIAYGAYCGARARFARLS